MSRKKADILKDIEHMQGLLSAQKAKIEALNNALTSLNGATVKAKWIPQSHGNIKATYHMAGTPYKNMSDHEGAGEDSIIKTLDKSLESERDKMVEIVNTALARANSLAMDYEGGLGTLQRQYEAAKN